MAPEIDDGIAYLMALKRGANAAAPAPARENPAGTEGEAPASGAHEGPEKRRSPRYKCEGSAEMYEAGCEVHTWATFTDISLHGCYVEAQATYPVGTVLRLKLEANGRKVEATGNVRVSYPYLGMGIAFAEISEDNRDRLKELVQSLARPSVIIGPGIASTLPALGKLEGLPEIDDPKAALQALVEFFEGRQLLMREDFVRIVRRSQNAETRH
ncbi:MAG TPA: PilZ domain-containing protein [Candidatus Sulfotelmatobacter sp.]|nr:PilZ domain-containing protein [Candidatus Sulfotelmatobacter sp.]